MEAALESMDVAKGMAEVGLQASASDAGVAALAARGAVMGAFLNVKINASEITDKTWIEDILKRGAAIQERAIALEEEILTAGSRKALTPVSRPAPRRSGPAEPKLARRRTPGSDHSCCRVTL